MKKMLFFAAVAIGMAACTNETDVICQQEPQEISFKAVTYKPTRAAVSGTEFPTTTDMYVSAWQKNDDTSQYIEYLSNAKFTKNVSNVWTGGYYYPITGVLHVQAYSCDYGTDQKIPSATLNRKEDEQKIKELVLDFSGNELTGSTDVMWSEIGFPKKNTSNRYDDLSLNFHHALSWIVVKFTTTNVNENLIDDNVKNAIQIRNVKLNGVNLTGTLTVTPTYDNSDTNGETVSSYSAVWSGNLDNTVEKDFPDYEPTNPATEITFGEAATVIKHKGLLVIPGTQSANTSISFKYRTKNGGTAQSPTYTDWITYTYTIGATEWEAEKNYIYDFNITFNEITISPSVVDWVESSNSVPLSEGNAGNNGGNAGGEGNGGSN